METVWAERESGAGCSGAVQSGAPRHPEEPFRETFLGLPQLPNCVNDLPGVEGAAAGVPFTLLGAGGWGDCAGVPGLGSDDDVDGAPAGLPALSLAESLSRPDLLVLFWPSCCAGLTFIFLQFGRTLYFSGRGPFWEQWNQDYNRLVWKLSHKKHQSMTIKARIYPQLSEKNLESREKYNKK